MQRNDSCGLRVMNMSESTFAVEENMAVVRRVVDEIWNAGNTEVADLLFAPEYINHGGLIPDLVRGPEAVKVSVVIYRLAFPNLHVAVGDVAANGDTVALKWTASHTPQTAANGTKPDWSFTGTTRSRLTGGRIVESWTSWDRQRGLPRWRLTASTGSAEEAWSEYLAQTPHQN
jgi:predicted SnoaL-like aldol condensation-catalyzing enzyme